MSSECLFCRIVAGELPSTAVHETETTFAFRDLHPQAPTHILIVPRAHYTDAVDLAKNEPALLGDLTLAAGAVAEAEGLAESGYRLVFNTGADAGQTVFHVHLHLLGGAQLGHFGTP
ncbi:histidine triad nucleotide-binding protein [Kibdelosporangium phytohabitans]|uniref:HIT domain-containing protein n=1 Tax=Kibdelosporangium phytohabitans TaxID=860235 RepID=A0A0N9HM09_9PSEU|nr:histidine triad nucleotide-binding protein [Kibdelosporangium phytohabitans]ALG07548.1 hypothetical protein AOZ06_12050 [Kibdelosporangium phytohabitans]MBE1471523.1 histidine triad (HIT) family protein [Kibdelosporangium phytohabitans]